MKIENGEQPILGLNANFELDQSVHVRTGAEHVRAQLNLTQHKEIYITNLDILSSPQTFQTRNRVNLTESQPG
jgi:hypothetical protein